MADRLSSSSPQRRARREKPQRIADEIRALILAGELDEGGSLGSEAALIERFGVSRPSLREALRILETEGLVSVVRGVLGGVVAHRPDQRQTARAAALALQSRDVPLSDVHEATTALEGAAAALIASSRARSRAARRLRELIAAEEEVIGEPGAFAAASARFRHELVALAGNETLVVVWEMLAEVISRAVAASPPPEGRSSSSARRRLVHGQATLVELILAGSADAAAAHWRTHRAAAAKAEFGPRARAVVDVTDHL